MRYTSLLRARWRWPLSSGKKSQMDIEIPKMNLPKELSAADGKADTAETDEFDEEILPVSHQTSSYESDLDAIRARRSVKKVDILNYSQNS